MTVTITEPTVTITEPAAGSPLPPRRGYRWSINPRDFHPIILDEDRENVDESSTLVNAPVDSLESGTPASLIPDYAKQLLDANWLVPDAPVIPVASVIGAQISSRIHLTDTAWRGFLRAFAPLHSAADAIIEAITDGIQQETGAPTRAQHAGLEAVARLVDKLQLSRPTVLRMGGVPQSTFYAWQKNPSSAIRTPTVDRLLRLQAQVAILEEALGRDRMTSWLMSAGRFKRLQGSESDFTRVLEEADTAVRAALPVVPRRRMHGRDYIASAADDAEASSPGTSTWPGARQVSDPDGRPT